jgi:hypothetical protein
MAVQSDWQKAQAAFRDWQERGGRASGPPPSIVRDMMRQKGLARDAELKAKGYGTANFNDLLKPLNRKAKETAGDKTAEQMNGGKKKPSLSEIRKAAKEGKTLVASLPSSCFSELTWTDGVATGTFINKTAGVWDWDCTLEEFLEWSQSGSLGEFFNDVIRE